MQARVQVDIRQVLPLSGREHVCGRTHSGLSPTARSWPKITGLKLSKRRVGIPGLVLPVAACPDRLMLPPCSGPSRRGLETLEIALPAECRPGLDSPCARRLAKSTVGADSPRFCKYFFALPSRFFSEVGRPDRSSMLAQPTARPSADSRPCECLAASPQMESRGRPRGSTGNLPRAPRRQLSGHAAVRAGPSC